MTFAVKLSLLTSGLFLLSGMITGVWKYAKIMGSPTHTAPVYVDIAHRTSFFYSFASLVIAALTMFSPFSATTQTIIVAFPLVFFVLSVAAYVREGLLDRTDNMFREPDKARSVFMYLLIASEIGGFLTILGGFIYTQFFK